MKHILVLVRHAHAQPHADGGDHARPLSARGHADARTLGEQLSRIVPSFDVVIYSDAERTSQTAEHLLRASPAQIAWADRQLYSAFPGDVLQLISSYSAAKSVLIIGHEPTISELGARLARTPGNITRGVPPATALVLRHDAEWPELTPNSCELEIVRPEL